jgi:hypothetical protein
MLERNFYAHSIDEEGNFFYDEKKDKRFILTLEVLMNQLDR